MPGGDFEENSRLAAKADAWLVVPGARRIIQAGRVARSRKLAIVAGIDEAGYGPVLGPLIVTGVAFNVPDELVDVSMWKLLAQAVARKPSRRRRRIAIADSKKLYSRQRARSLEHLERGVLAMLAAGGNRPETFGRLLASVSPASQPCAAAYPWYADGELAIPRCISRTDLALGANALSVAMKQAGVSLADVRVECLFVRQFNSMIEATRNKSVALLSVTSRLLMRLWDIAPGGLLRVYVDRQGGRVRYLNELQRIFEGAALKIVDESDSLSAYSISDGRRRAEIVFSPACEDKQLPVALASMTSKYVRELFMKLVNDYWLRHLPGLAATAGYYTDGRRFYGEIRPLVRKLNIDERMIYRCR